MVTRIDDIPDTQWHDFFQRFSRGHHNWLASITQCDTAALNADRVAPVGPAPARPIDHRPLQEITLNELAGDRTMNVILGHGADQVNHVIRGPERLRCERDEQDRHLGLRIDDHEGRTTLLRFRAAALPEELDGINPANLA